MASAKLFLAGLGLSLLLVGCAVNVTHAPTAFVPSSDTDRQRVSLDQAVEIHLDTGYNRTLAAGSAWRRVGRIVHGDVYKPENTIFTLEGAHVHEAWLVVADGRLVGFYLPVERGFSPSMRVVALPLSSTKTMREQ